MSATLDLQLVPLRLTEAAPVPTGTGSELAIAGSQNQDIVLRPAEPHEVSIRLENRSARPLNFELRAVGNFPSEWCEILTPTTSLQPHQQQEAVLLFRVPPDYFEQTGALAAGDHHTLDYSGNLEVYAAHDDAPRQLVETAVFNVFVRPTSLYSDFVPSIYRQSDFLNRFLALFEQAFEPDVEILDNFWAYLDPLLAPESLLPFLAHWVGWPLQPQLNLNEQRQLIRHAMTIYRWRGTRRGLRFALHLVTGLPLDVQAASENERHIGIYESFSRGFVLGETQIGQDATLGGGQPYHFSVRLRLLPGMELERAAIETTIEREKPAFCTYDLMLEPAGSGPDANGQQSALNT